MDEDRIWNVREVAFAMEVSPDSVYSYFKSRGVKLNDGGVPGITTEQFDELIDSKNAGHFGSKQKKLSKTEVKDARYHIAMRTDGAQMVI